MTATDQSVSAAASASRQNGVAPATRNLRLSLDQIETCDQVRKFFDAEKLQSLAASLKTEGQLQPILVYQDESRGKCIVLAGERRYRAAKMAGLDALDCIVFPRKPTRSEIAIVQITENTLREGLDPIEQATAFGDVMEQDHLNASGLAERLHLSVSTVTRAIALLDLPADLQTQIRGGELSPALARELARLPQESQRREILARVRSEDLTAKEAAVLVSKLLKAKKKPGRKAKPAKTTHRLGGFEAVLTPKRITLSLLPSKKSRTHEDTITALEALIHKLREDAAKSQSVSV